MKQETKELITGLKNWYEKFRSEAPLTPYTEWAVGDGDGYADEGASNMDKVITLLDSLEGLENQLKHGGFIPDRNGKPCKDGDKIEICLDGLRSGEIVSGQLRWDDKHYLFLCEGDDISLSPGEKDEADYIGIQWFEKEDEVRTLKLELREKLGLPNREVIVFDFEKQSFSDLRDLTEKYFVYVGKGQYITQLLSMDEQMNFAPIRTTSIKAPVNSGLSIAFTENGNYVDDNVFSGLCADMEMFDSSGDFGEDAQGWHEPKCIWPEERRLYGIDKFTCGTAQISMIKENLYSVAISSADGKQIAKFKVDDRLDDTWQGFKVGDEEYDINIYSSELYGTGNAKWEATVYPIRNGFIDLQIMVQLKVKEV
ncbi:MAG: hypothetical protein IKQ43_09905 [Treponema sp.]|nr:hypothetical protein [Treponema sp.]MBR7080994.1 hypothetical protein [Treponema sp.]